MIVKMLFTCSLLCAFCFVTVAANGQNAAPAAQEDENIARQALFTDRKIETEFKAMKEKFGLPYALYVKLRRYQFQLKQSYDSDMQEAAFSVADEIIRTAPESQFAEAAKYIKGAIRAHMLSDQSDKKSIREVKKYLEGFIKENPKGLYRGEALMLLGKISLECELDAEETEKYYNQALACFQKAYEKQSAVSMYDPLPENLKRQVTPEQPLRIVCGQWSRMENRNEDPLKLYNTACAPGWYADYCKKICTLVLGADLLWRKKYDEAEKMWGTIINSDPDIRQRQAESKPNLLMSLQALCNETKMGGRKERRFPLLWEKVLKLAEQSYWHVEAYAQSDIDLQFKELVPLHREEYKVKRDLFLKRDEAEVTAFLKAKLQDKSIDPRERFQANILLERVENKQEIEHFWDRRKRTAQEIEKMREGRSRGAGLKLSGIVFEEESACTPLEEIDSITFLREKETKLIYFFLEKFWKTPDADEHMRTRRRTGTIQHSYYDGLTGKEFKGFMCKRDGDCLFIDFLFQKTAVPQKLEEWRICADDQFVGKKYSYRIFRSSVEQTLWELACYYNWRECFPRMFECAANVNYTDADADIYILMLRATKDDIPYLQRIKHTIGWYYIAAGVIRALNENKFYENFILPNGRIWSDIWSGYWNGSNGSLVIKFLPVLPELEKAIEQYKAKCDLRNTDSPKVRRP